MELDLRVGLLSPHLFLRSRAMDIVFPTLFCTTVETVTAWYTSCCTMPSGHCLNIFVVLVAVHSILGLLGWCLQSTFTPLPPPSLINNLISVDVKQIDSFSVKQTKHIPPAEQPLFPSLAPETPDGQHPGDTVHRIRPAPLCCCPLQVSQLCHIPAFLKLHFCEMWCYCCFYLTLGNVK